MRALKLGALYYNNRPRCTVGAGLPDTAWFSVIVENQGICNIKRELLQFELDELLANVLNKFTYDSIHYAIRSLCCKLTRESGR